MSAYLKGCDVVVGDAQADAVRAIALKQAEEERKKADAGGWTLGNFIFIGAIGLVALVAWPHVRKWV